MSELERGLFELGRAIELPPTPDLTRAVRGHLGERRHSWRRPVATALAVLVVATGAVLAVPAARTAILDWLGLRGVRIVYVAKLPPARAVGKLDLGRQITLAEARRRAPWITVPGAKGVGPPDHVYYGTDIPGGRISLLWGTPRSVHLLLTEFRAQAFIGKLIRSETKVDRVEVNGSPGAWLGEPHVFLYFDREGRVRESTARLAGNTLFWERGQVTLRLEGDLTKDDALRIARSSR